MNRFIRSAASLPATSLRPSNFSSATHQAVENNAIGVERYYWYMAWKGLDKTRTWRLHWPNYPAVPSSGGPLTTNESTRGMKYALTPQRLDTINRAIKYEELSSHGSKGRKPVLNGCY